MFLQNHTAFALLEICIGEKNKQAVDRRNVTDQKNQRLLIIFSSSFIPRSQIVMKIITEMLRDMENRPGFLEKHCPRLSVVFDGYQVITQPRPRQNWYIVVFDQLMGGSAFGFVATSPWVGLHAFYSFQVALVFFFKFYQKTIS